MAGFVKVCIASLAALCVATAAQAAGVRETGAWVTVCDNLRTCTAFLLSDTRRHDRTAESVAYVMLHREGGANAPLDLDLISHIDAGVENGPWALWVDGRRDVKFGTLNLQFSFTDPPDGYLEPSLWKAFLTGAQKDRLLAALRQHHALSLRMTDRHRVDFQLAGAAQALGWMDAEQLRTGMDSALWRKGRKPETLPPLPVAPKIVLAAKVDQSHLPVPPAALQEFARASCKGAKISWFVEQRLAPNLILSAPACEETHLYFASDLFVVDETTGAYHAIALPIPPGEAPATFRAGVTNEDQDPRYVHLSPPDNSCGRGAAWVWTGSGFAVQHERLVLACRGVFAFHDMTLYRTERVDPDKPH